MLATSFIAITFLGSLLDAGGEAKNQAGSEPRAARTDRPYVFDAILRDQASVPEISTAELQAALERASAVILDARPYDEYAVSHIPRARTVPGKPDTPPALYVADVNTVLSTIADKKQPLILYCNKTAPKTNTERP